MANQSFKFIFIRVLYVLVFINIGIHQALAEKTNNNKIYTVGYAQDTLANDWRRAQVNELTKQFKRQPNIKFIVTDAGGNSAKQIQYIEDLAHQKVDLIITSPRDGRENTPVDAIYSQSDSMAVGARLTLKKSAIAAKDKLIVGIDYINEARDAIKAGEQAASFIYPTCAKETADVVLKILKGNKVAKKNV